MSSTASSASSSSTPTQCHSAFTQLREETISSLNLTATIYEHNKTKCQHIHLAADHPENVFLVAFRTMPTDSTGVAHILEHTALCGSKNYPVRDPFFMMIRRSLNTFMNAFTSSDWTAYPFASKNRKDYDNLLSVYLDATFFSRLDPLDFAQEGHRMEFEEPDNLDSDLVFKGVVFNEMKGAMSSPASLVYDAIGRYINPTNTYHFNSGGEPSHIPDLSYEQLIAFYKTHYHPSNATFVTFGDIPAHELQATFEEKALQHFDYLDRTISVAPEKRYFAPICVTEHFALDPQTPTADQTHHLFGWLLNNGNDLEHRLEAQLLSNVLLDNSASPLMKALETFPGAKSPGPICGLEDGHLELSFYCGVEGSNPDQAAAFEACVLNTLKRIVEEGVDQDQVESVLHQLELSQREITGSRYPYGLQLILSCLSGSIHRGDPIALLNLDPALDKLREAIKDREFIPRLARKLLLENPHRVRLTMIPDHDISARRDAAEKARLAAAKAAMETSELGKINELAKTLKARQEQEDDLSILPKVELSDIPKEIHFPQPEAAPDADQPPLKRKTTSYVQGTNGIAYQQLVVETPNLADAELDLLPIYTTCFSELGTQQKDYLEMQAWQARVSGGLQADSRFFCPLESQTTKSLLTFSGKALSRNHGKLTELLHTTFETLQFNESDRLKELIEQARTSMEQRVTGNGHSLAMLAAGNGLSGLQHIHHRHSGLAALQKIKQLAKSIETPSELEHLQTQLTQLHDKITQAPRTMLIIGDQEPMSTYQEQVLSAWNSGSNYHLGQKAGQSAQTEEDPNGPAVDAFEFQYEATPKQEVWLTNTQVNFCAKAFSCVTKAHDDAPALEVLAPYLRNGYLHRAIREQGGAYGGGASFANASGLFRFYSYRDPRFIETLDDFDQSIHWLLDKKQDPEHLEQAILNVVSVIDRPSSPSKEASKAFHHELTGIDNEFQKAYRAKVIKVSLDDLRRVAQQYLLPSDASSPMTSTAVISQQATWESIEDQINLTTIVV